MTERAKQASRLWPWMVVLGCVAVVVLAAIALAAIAAITHRGYGRELRVARELDRRYGSYDSYQAPADGRVPANRMERFLAVRRAVLPHCGEVTDVVSAFGSVGSYAKQHRPDVGQLFGRVGQAIRRVPTMGLVFGRYVSARSQALQAQEMGLGEYSWLYVVSYFSMLGASPVPVLERSEPYSLFEDRVFPAFASAIRRRVAASAATEGPWEEELRRLQANPGRVPFSGGLPIELAASLEPYREKLAATACPAAAELDLTITVERPLFGYDHR